jgi:hypothetical protein
MNTTILFLNYEVHGDDVQYPMIEFSELKGVVWIVGLNIVTLEAKKLVWSKVSRRVDGITTPIKIFNLF